MRSDKQDQSSERIPTSMIVCSQHLKATELGPAYTHQGPPDPRLRETTGLFVGGGGGRDGRPCKCNAEQKAIWSRAKVCKKLTCAEG